ncbi:MAG: hypothetical protein CVU38_06020 [Chloroflexi bacterium HGW-Chloroflexi-1]|nr:MAG: hypothetical protein CVU38_06020 [Chloroflexi bacterium HGW-Chloroflexi-1]
MTVNLVSTGKRGASDERSRPVVQMPEYLRNQTRTLAALRGQTISEFVRQALAEYVRNALEEAEEVRETDRIMAQIREGAPTYAP